MSGTLALWWPASGRRCRQREARRRSNAQACCPGPSARGIRMAAARELRYEPGTAVDARASRGRDGSRLSRCTRRAHRRARILRPMSVLCVAACDQSRPSPALRAGLRALGKGSASGCPLARRLSGAHPLL
jgi:hypothetical protein